MNQLSSESLNDPFALADAGRWPEAIALLSAMNRQQRRTLWERTLVDWRRKAARTQPPLPQTAAKASPSPSPSPWTIDPAHGLPEVAAATLDAGLLSSAIQQHGALLVRGLLHQAQVAHLVAGIDKALAARLVPEQLSEEGWYARLSAAAGDENVTDARPWVESAGGVWLADSPRMLFDYLGMLESTRAIAAITGCLGERPWLSVGKSTLRCVPHTIKVADWHQDGAFMGEQIRSVNLWLSLSPCGDKASGLELVPRRVDRILPTGTHGAHFKWSVGPALVDELAGEGGTRSPRFEAGDALLFDHYFLHRTGIPAGICQDRYAIESWFFAPSAYPAKQGPLYL